jgi:ATP-dependent DNA helicase RecG
MPIEIVQITKEQGDFILSQKEGHFLDFKAIEIKPSKLTNTISAFTNASGGELYIGIEQFDLLGSPSFSWRGFKTPENANSHIQVFEELFPLGQYYSYTFLQNPSATGLVLQVEIRKSRQIALASDGLAYLRRNAQNLPQDTPEKLNRLRLDKGIVSFESDTVDAQMEIVSNAAPLLDFLTNVIPNAEPEPWLNKQQLTKNGKPTVAAVLLFADEPQAILPKRCGIKLYRYKSTDAVGTRETLAGDPLTIEGHLYVQIKTAVQKTVELVEGIQKLGPKGLEPIQYPHETLHEILTNAVLHRDYSIASDIHIRIFDNRVEIESPGKLPGHITEDNILTEQFARNGAIVRMINKFPNPPNKDVGEGLNTAFNAMSALRLKPPVIDGRDNSVIIHIKHEPLASPDETVMEFLESHSEIVNRIARKITGIQSENSMKNVFYRLRDRGMIEPVPGREGFGSAWRKPSPK